MFPAKNLEKSSHLAECKVVLSGWAQRFYNCNMNENDADDGSNLRQALFMVSDAVLGAAVLLAIGIFAGSWIDKQLHTAPWFSTGLALLGGGFGLARMVMKANSLQSSSNIGSKSSRPDKVPQKAVKKTDGSAQRNPFDDFEDEQN